MITNFLRRQHIVIYVIIFYSLITFIWSVYFLLKETLNIYDIEFFAPPSINNDGVLKLIIGALIVAPLLETLFFQKFIYYLFSKISYLKIRNILSCLVSGLLFGLSHTYSLYYMFSTTIIGFVLMYAYLIHIKNQKQSYWIVVTIHFLINLSALIENLISQRLLI